LRDALELRWNVIIHNFDFKSFPDINIFLINSSFLVAVEGWVIFVRNVHAEAAEDDVVDKFSDFGDVKGIQLNLDRQTGFVKVPRLSVENLLINMILYSVNIL